MHDEFDLFLEEVNTFLSEADGDNPPDVGTNDSEPMEQDAAVGNDDGGLGGGSDDDSSDGGEDDGMGDLGGDDDSSSDDGGGMDDGTDGEEDVSDVDKAEINRKIKLLDDYKELIDVNSNLIKVSALINTNIMTDKEKKLYNYCCAKLQENYDKLIIILNREYENMSYEKLLTLFYYCKIVCMNFSEMINVFNGRIEDINLKHKKITVTQNNKAPNVTSDKNIRRVYPT
jgi:hypothetical protein